MTDTVLNQHGNPVLNLHRDVDAFTRGYITAALWTEEEELQNKGWTDLAPQTLQGMMDDCRKFQEQEATMLARATYGNKPGGGDSEYAGQDFWLTRNGHGAGFWDGDLPDDVGESLTEACKRFGETWLYLGDDGLIYSN